MWYTSGPGEAMVEAGGAGAADRARAVALGCCCCACTGAPPPPLPLLALHRRADGRAAAAPTEEERGGRPLGAAARRSRPWLIARASMHWVLQGVGGRGTGARGVPRCVS